MAQARGILGVLKACDALIVPGGGVFADTVRKVYEDLKLSEEAAHKMAIISMDQYGLFLSDISGIPASESIDTHPPFIFLPSRFLMRNAPFESSWDITSDTLACFIAKNAKVERFIILTDVDGIVIEGKLVGEISAAELLKYGETCVDKALPKYLMEYGIDCWVINGRDLKKVEEAIRGNPTGTVIKH